MWITLLQYIIWNGIELLQKMYSLGPKLYEMFIHFFLPHDWTFHKVLSKASFWDILLACKQSKKHDPTTSI